MKKILLFLIMLLVVVNTSAVPAKRVWRSYVQSDGSCIELMLVGDENLHYYITRDEVPVVEEDEQFCYAKAVGFAIKSTGVMAHEPQDRSSAEKAHLSTISEMESVREYVSIKGVRRNDGVLKMPAINEASRPAFTGSKKGLIILANFSDKKFYDYQESDGGMATWERYDALANLEGYTNETYGAIGSVHDYYYDQSYGLFDLTFDVIGPINLDKDYSYYGSNAGGDDLHSPEMILECCQKVDSLVDFNDYDWNGDGVVEEVFVLYAGYGEATGGSKLTIWPHMWQLSLAAMSNSNIPYPVKFDNVVIDVYACSNELYDSRGTTEIGLGVICHEFSHCLGLPDLYDTSYAGNFGMGNWDILDNGSYNGPLGIGWVPAGYSSYERNYAGWMKYTELKGHRRVVNQKPLNEHGNAYIIYNEAYKNEYYILENRNQTGWDEYLPGSGLLIIHVDYDKKLWDNNMVNTIGKGNNHQRLTCFHASNSTRGGNEAYPYKSNDCLTDYSKPAATLYHANIDGTKLMHKPITEITRDPMTGNISFLFMADNSRLPDGIITVADDSEALVDVYNLEGVRVAEKMAASEVRKLKNGVYILRHEDGSSKKIVIK